MNIAARVHVFAIRAFLRWHKELLWRNGVLPNKAQDKRVLLVEDDYLVAMIVIEVFDTALASR